MIEKTAVFARYLLQPNESSCQREQSIKAGLNAMPSAAEVAETESFDKGLAMEALVLPVYPIGKHHVQVVHHFDKLGLAKLVVVIVPTSHLALNLYCYLLEFPAKMGMFSISQMSNDELVQSLPWRENICKANATSIGKTSKDVFMVFFYLREKRT